MTFNRDMSAAPKGETEALTLTHHQSGKSFTKTIRVKTPIILSVGDTVIKSFWSETRGQWSGVADNETPDGWMPWPKPIGEAQ